MAMGRRTDPHQLDLFIIHCPFACSVCKVSLETSRWYLPFMFRALGRVSVGICCPAAVKGIGWKAAMEVRRPATEVI
jgi:hypothetical protein